VKKMNAIELLTLGDYQLKKIIRLKTAELIAQACASGASHNDTSKVIELIDSQNPRTRMGRALLEKLPVLAKALKDVYAGRPNHLPTLPESAISFIGKQRENLIKQWSLEVAEATIVSAELSCKELADAAKAVRATNSSSQ